MAYEIVKNLHHLYIRRDKWISCMGCLSFLLSFSLDPSVGQLLYGMIKAI